MSHKFVQIIDNKAHWIFDDDLDLNSLYNQKYSKKMKFIDISNLVDKIHEGWIYDGSSFKEPSKPVPKDTGSSGVGTILKIDVSIPAASWASGAYTYTNSNITESSMVFIAPPENCVAANYDAIANAKIICSAHTAGSLTLKCLGNVPTTAISLTIGITCSGLKVVNS